MNEVFRVNAWRVYQEDYGYQITNLDRGVTCKWLRRIGRFMYPMSSFRVPVTIERVINTRESLLRNDSLSDRTYGIEIECYHSSNSDIKQEVCSALSRVGISCQFLGYTHTVTTGWKIVTDSSIRGGYGLEVVSPILSGEEGLEQIKKVTKVLSELGCKVNRSTGLHVHHGARDLSQTEIKNVFKLYRENESLFDSLVAPSRRDSRNQYCQSLRNHTDLPSTRYTKVNYQSFVKYGTIEVRHHQGSLNADKIIHWIRLTQRVIERAGSYSRSFGNLEEMLGFMGLQSMENWYLERAEELSA